MKKFLKFVGIFLLIIIIISLGALLYIGIIPGVAKPVNLGSKNDPALFANFNMSHGMKSEIPGGVVPDSRQAEFSGQTVLNTDISADEITSILAAWKTRSPKLPVRQVQVRFNSDGTGEISGILEIKTAISIAKTLGYNDNDIEEGKKYIKYSAGDIPFYAKGTGGVTNNNVTLNPTNFKIGNVNVPSQITEKVAPIVSDAIEKRINQVGTIQVRSIDFSKGKLHFDGTIPDTVK